MSYTRREFGTLVSGALAAGTLGGTPVLAALGAQAPAAASGSARAGAGHRRLELLLVRRRARDAGARNRHQRDRRCTSSTGFRRACGIRIAVVLIHGGYGQGTDWISTPDGRRGWASQFLEQGYKVYVVDRPGQGRNPHHPFVHGLFDAQAPTFEGGRAPDRRRLGQGSHAVAGRRQRRRSRRSPRWSRRSGSRWPTTRSRRASGVRAAPCCSTTSARPFFVTHGDGAVFAWVTAQERPALVKGIVASSRSRSRCRPDAAQLAGLAHVPIAIVTAEASPAAATDPGIVATLRGAGCTVEHIRLADHGVRGNGPMVMMEKNNREALQPILAWLRHRRRRAPAHRRSRPAASISNRQSRVDRAEARRSGLLLGWRPAQADALRHHRAGPDVRAVHDPGREAVSVSGDHGPRRRRAGHAHDGPRPASRLGALLRAGRLQRLLARSTELRPLAVSSRRARPEPSAERAAARGAGRRDERLQDRRSGPDPAA